VFGKSLGASKKAFAGLWPVFVVSFLLAVPYVGLPQNLPVPNSTIAEEQDYAFAYGLFKDGLFQNAAEQFTNFVKKYPQSIKIQDAQFLYADCFFQMEKYGDAAREFSSFVRHYPFSPLSDNARFRLGDTYARLNRSRDAIETYKSILDQPKNPAVAGEAAYWIAEIYFKESDYANAVKYYALSFEGYPGHRLQDYAAYSVAWTSQRKGDYSKAAEWYRLLVQKLPQSPLVSSALVKTGECLFAMKDYRGAITQLTEARGKIDSVALRGDADYTIAESYYHLDEFENAAKSYEAFLREYPEHRLTTEVQYALAWSYFKDRRFSEAAQAFGKVASFDSQLGRAAAYRKGVAEKLAGKRAEALAAFQQIYGSDLQSEYADNALYDAGVILFEDKKMEEAKKCFARVVSEFGNSDVLADASMMLGESYLATGAFDSARTAYTKALSSEGMSFETKVNSIYQSAWSNFKLRNYKEAVTGFTRFLAAYAEHPKSAEAKYWLAESEYLGGNYRNALKHYQDIVKLPTHPRREESMYGIGWSQYRLKDYSKAIDAFERLILSYPSGKSSFDARLRLGDCYFQMKDYKKAAGAYRTVTRLFPKNEGADYAAYQLGQTYYRSGDHEQATDQFAALMKNYPTSNLTDDAQFALGWIKFQRKDFLGAIRDFQSLLTSYPSSELLPRATYSIGDAYYNLRQYGPAEKAYREVLQKYPQSPVAQDALTGIQYCLVAQGKSKEAVGTIEEYVKRNPASPNTEQLEIKKADLLFSQREFAEATKEYRAFAQRYPNSTLRAQALFGLAKSLQQSDSLTAAAATYQEAAAATGATLSIRGNALLETSRILLKQKEYEQAYRILAEAEASLAGSEFAPEVAYTKGLIFVDNGATDDAKSAFDAVIASFPSSIEADRARNALARIATGEQKYSEAQAVAQKVATSRTDDIGAEAQYLSGFAHEQNAEWQQAVTAYLRLKYVFPSHERWLVKAYVGLGRVYEQLKDNTKAREAYQQVLKMSSGGAEFEEATRGMTRVGQE